MAPQPLPDQDPCPGVWGDQANRSGSWGLKGENLDGVQLGVQNVAVERGPQEAAPVGGLGPTKGAQPPSPLLFAAARDRANGLRDGHVTEELDCRPEDKELGG